MSRETTLHGHDPHCGLCGLRVYGIWVSKEPPPFCCSDGLDDAPWTCSHVIASLQMGTILVDEMGGELKPHHHRLIQVVGQERANAIMSYCRENHAPPKSGKRREPNYDRPPAN